MPDVLKFAMVGLFRYGCVEIGRDGHGNWPRFLIQELVKTFGARSLDSGRKGGGMVEA